jgi:hypothetical protein
VGNAGKAVVFTHSAGGPRAQTIKQDRA